MEKYQAIKSNKDNKMLISNYIYFHKRLYFVSLSINIFARSNAEVVGSNPTRGMDVCLPLFCVFVVLCR
jgi:hypothetical protein